MPRRRREGEATPRKPDQWQRITEPGQGALFRGYVRYSHIEGRHGLSIENQKRAILDYANARGWKLAGWDEEPAQSAKYEDIGQRPGFKYHIEAAERHEIEVSLVVVNDRWARNRLVADSSLSRLRHANIWWATADGRWDINRILEDGWDVAYAIDATLNAAYSRKVSEKTKVGKMTRAELGFHNGDVMFGYQAAPRLVPPPGSPYDWKPPRRPAQPHPEAFDQLRQIGEWSASGYTDGEIARMCNVRGWRTRTSKAIGPKRHIRSDDTGKPVTEHEYIGPRPFSKDTIRAILIREYPQEFAPGCGKGTIMTPDNRRVMGQHIAAFSWETWHQIDEMRARRQTAPSLGRSPSRVWLFSGMVTCAACGNCLRAHGSRRESNTNYRDEARSRGLECSSTGPRSVRASLLADQVASLLLDHPLPNDWRDGIARAFARTSGAVKWEAVDAQRAELNAKLERLRYQHIEGFLDDATFRAQASRLRQVLDDLPQRSMFERAASETMTAATTLSSLNAYWMHMTEEERAELVRLLLCPRGIIYDLNGQQIVGLRPQRSFLEPLHLMLRDWDLENCMLWQPTWLWRARGAEMKKAAENILRLPSTSGGPDGDRLREFDTKYGATVHGSKRPDADSPFPAYFPLSSSRDLPSSSQKRTACRLDGVQMAEVCARARQGTSLRELARAYGISHETVRRLLAPKQSPCTQTADISGA